MAASTMENFSKLDFEDKLQKIYSNSDECSSSSNSESSDYSSDEEFTSTLNSKQNNNPNYSKRLQTSRPERQPTRKPDPNTCNRNALMARENRRKKKEYIEKLEKNIQKCYKNQKSMQKLVKKQAKFIRKLQNEKRYYRSILENKTHIFSLIDSVVKRTDSLTSTTLPRETPETSPTYSLADSGHYSTESDYNKYEYDLKSTSLDDSWDNLLGYNTPFEDILQEEVKEVIPQNITQCQNNINNEHNYVTTNNVNINDHQMSKNAGVCLHINGGKMSLEFCPKCSERSSLKIFEEQLDVLNE